jgi:hypothetical protein
VGELGAMVGRAYFSRIKVMALFDAEVGELGGDVSTECIVRVRG